MVGWDLLTQLSSYLMRLVLPDLAFLQTLYAPCITYKLILVKVHLVQVLLVP